MANNPANQHSMPKWILIPSNAVTTFQIVNMGALAWWTVMLYTNGNSYEQSSSFESLGTLAPSIGWWMGITVFVLLCNLLPIVRWWSTRINRTYRTKFAGLSMSAGWWGYIAVMFEIGQGWDLGFGIHAVLAIGAVYESFRLVKGRI